MVALATVRELSPGKTTRMPPTTPLAALPLLSVRAANVFLGVIISIISFYLLNSILRAKLLHISRITIRLSQFIFPLPEILHTCRKLCIIPMIPQGLHNNRLAAPRMAAIRYEKTETAKPFCLFLPCKSQDFVSFLQKKELILF